MLPTIGPFGSIALWVVFLAVVSLSMSLIGAYIARHEVGYPGDIHEFLPMVGYLLQVSVVAGIPALAAVMVTELTSVLGGGRPAWYSPAILVRRRVYILTLLAVAVALIVLYELRSVGPFIRLGPRTYAAPYWWWILTPAALCLAHVLSLTRDRWQAQSWRSMVLIPSSALTSFAVCWLLFAWPLPSLGLHPAAAAPLYPTNFRPCEYVPPPPGPATAAVRCHPDSVSIFIRVGDDRLDQEFVAGAPISERCPNAMPALHAFYIGGERRGSLLCKYNANGHVVLAWTDLRTNGYTKATFASSYSLDTAYRWWTANAYEVGPRPSPGPPK